MYIKAKSILLAFRSGASFVDHFCYLRFVFVMLTSLFIAVLKSPAGKVLTSWLSCMWCFIVCVFFFTFPCGVLGQVWYLIVLIPDIYLFLNFIYSSEKLLKLNVVLAAEAYENVW